MPKTKKSARQLRDELEIRDWWRERLRIDVPRRLPDGGRLTPHLGWERPR